MTFFFRDAGVVTAAEEKDTGRVVRVVSGGRTVNGRSDEDTDTENFETLANDRNMNAAQGAGIQAAQAVAAASADIVISGNIGPKAYQVLAASGIKTVLWAEGSVAQAIKLFRNNQIKVSDGASVEGHWM
jgi:predicted Fe-Mo cluster-binding NifX family protein